MKITTYFYELAKYVVVLCAVPLLIPGVGTAASWSIDPIRLELSPTKQTATLKITNDTDLPTSIQIQSVAWTQVNGVDIYTPTKELLVSPPIVTIAPKSLQIVRVALRKQIDPTTEMTYRINLLELPIEKKNKELAIQVALRIGLPVFVQSLKSDAAPKMAWKIFSSPDNGVKLAVRNEGTAHVQVSDFALFAHDSEKFISGETGSTYVLAGQSYEWLLRSISDTKNINRQIRLKASTDAENIDTLLVLEKP
jgi:fimbrial chaperone protein